MELTITQARRLRHKERQARLEILQEIDSLEKRRCAKCRTTSRAAMLVGNYRCGCSVAIEIRRLAALLP